MALHLFLTKFQTKLCSKVIKRNLEKLINVRKMSVMSVKIKYTDKLVNGICSLSGIFVLFIVLNSCQIAFL